MITFDFSTNPPPRSIVASSLFSAKLVSLGTHCCLLTSIGHRSNPTAVHKRVDVLRLQLCCCCYSCEDRRHHVTHTQIDSVREYWWIFDLCRVRCASARDRWTLRTSHLCGQSLTHSRKSLLPFWHICFLCDHKKVCTRPLRQRTL